MKVLLKSRLSLLTILPAILVIVLTRSPSSSAQTYDGSRKSTTSKMPSSKTLNGTATYYPNSLNGHKTASGETFHQNGNTAASNKLPLGTDVKVTNLENGNSTDVKVTDRGSKLGNHKIDLSKKAAREIGLTQKEGKVPVKIKVTRTPDELTAPSPTP